MLTDENVHPSISKATYIIEIESCSEHIVEKRIIEEEIKGEKNGRN